MTDFQVLKCRLIRLGSGGVEVGYIDNGQKRALKIYDNDAALSFPLTVGKFLAARRWFDMVLLKMFRLPVSKALRVKVSKCSI